MCTNSKEFLTHAAIMAAVIAIFVVPLLMLLAFDVDRERDMEKARATLAPNSAGKYVRCTEGGRKSVCLMMFPDNTEKFAECKISRKPLSDFAAAR